MSEKSKQDKKKYGYRYVQFTLTSVEKKQVKEFARKENFRSISDFMRRVLFDYIRRREHWRLLTCYYFTIREYPAILKEIINDMEFSPQMRHKALYKIVL